MDNTQSNSEKSNQPSVLSGAPHSSTYSSGTVPTGSPQPTNKSKGKSGVWAVLIVLLLIAAAGAGGWGLQANGRAKEAVSKSEDAQKEIDSLKKEVEDRKETTGENNIDHDGFQAVFLKEGQVYFGKITSIGETQLILEDIYYLKDGNQINPDGALSHNAPSLVKLGDELHGPQDKMFIERKEVQFWENLKADSQVAKAIAEFKKSQGQ